MRNPIPIVLALAVLSTAAYADSDGHLNFFLGQKALDDGDWDPVDRQVEIGAVAALGKDTWPVHVALDFLVSGDDGTMSDPILGDIDVHGETIEIGSGVRKVWKRASARPYVGAGIAIIGASAELDSPFGSADAKEQTIGGWLGAGIFWTPGTRLNIGFDVRWSSAEVDLDFGGGLVSRDVKAGGLHAGLLLGFGW
jgi:hypothetical protein